MPTVVTSLFSNVWRGKGKNVHLTRKGFSNPRWEEDHPPSECLEKGGAAWIIQFSETSAVIRTEGELSRWENVRLHLFDPNGDEMQGKIYGKVISVKPLTDNLREAVVRFTSVSPGMFQIIRKTAGTS